MNQNKKLIVIAGPTASGKTLLSIEVAKYFNTEIINADSRQVFKELNIGVAKPSDDELNSVKHHLISVRSIADNYSAGQYENDALEILNNIFSEKDYAVLVGGTGLYIKALLEGFDEMPEIDTETRLAVWQLYSKDGINGVGEQLLKIDPEAEKLVSFNNPARLTRALELVLQTQKPLKQIWNNNKTKREFTPIVYGINWQREILYDRINTRVDAMIKDGLEAEVKNLTPYRNLPALQTVGYLDFFDYFDGKISLTECIEKIKQHTRNYAKRQITWFKNSAEIKWVSPKLALEVIMKDLENKK